jgi:hypothetical protein
VTILEIISQELAQILLIPDAFLNLPLKLCGINQWTLHPLLQLLGQSFNDFSRMFSIWTIRGSDLEDEVQPDCLPSSSEILPFLKCQYNA